MNGSTTDPEEKISSLQFTTEKLTDVTGTSSGAMTGYIKNIETDNLKLRMEIDIEDQDFMKLIANGEQKKAWMWVVFSNVWVDISNDFDNQWANAETLVDQILLGYSSGTLAEFNYTDPTTNETQTFKIANYQINPTLEDSLFEVESTDNTIGDNEYGYATVVVRDDYADRTREGIIMVFGNVENTGTKSGKNCKLEINVVFDIDNITQVKTETVTIGDIPSGTVKEFNTTIQLPDGVNTAMAGYNINVWWD